MIVNEELLIGILKCIREMKSQNSDELHWYEFKEKFPNISEENLYQHIRHAQHMGYISGDVQEYENMDGYVGKFGGLRSLNSEGNAIIRKYERKIFLGRLKAFSPLFWIIFGAIAANHSDKLFEKFLKWTGIY